MLNRDAQLRELAAVLWQGVRPSRETDHDSLAIIGRYSQLNVDTLLGELLFLRVAALDFAAYAALDNSPLKTQLLNEFFTPFEQQGRQHAQYARNFATMRARVASYSEAATTDDTKQFLWNVGKLFAAFCQCRLEPAVAMVGSTVFGGTVAAAEAAIKEAGLTP